MSITVNKKAFHDYFVEEKYEAGIALEGWEVKVERAGYTLVPIDLHFVRGRIKLEIGLAKGKKQHDKRADALDKDSKREAQRAMKERLH